MKRALSHSSRRSAPLWILFRCQVEVKNVKDIVKIDVFGAVLWKLASLANMVFTASLKQAAILNESGHLTLYQFWDFIIKLCIAHDIFNLLCIQVSFYIKVCNFVLLKMTTEWMTLILGTLVFFITCYCTAKKEKKVQSQLFSNIITEQWVKTQIFK